VSPFPDTSKQQAPATPRTPRAPIPPRWFYPRLAGWKLLAPEGYAFNGRGDLIRVTREEARVGHAITVQRKEAA